jgi:arylsulfatase A-like enzyme
MGRFLEAIAPDLGGFLAAGLVFGGAYIIWNATGHLHGVPPAEMETQFGDTDGGAPDPEGKTETTAADGGSPRSSAQGPAGKTYNVILISVDTLRADLGFMGYPRPVSANIDQLASKSVVFERTYAMASFTPKCLGPLMIGRYSSETYRDYEHYTKFFPENVFLAERLHNAGNRTFAAMCHRYFGWKKGMDQGFDIWDTSSIPPNSVDNDPTPTSEKLTDTAIGLLSSSRGADIPVRGGKAAVTTGRPNGRFFAWFHYLDPHLPYVAHEGSPAFSNMGGAGIPSQRGPYDGEVWYTDKHVGRLLQFIATQPWSTETAIIFTADHGEAFGEHGHWGHGRELWEPLVRVPLIVSIPGIGPRHIQQRRSHVDLVPTVLDLMGIPPDDPLLHGKSLLRDINNPGQPEDREQYIDMPDGPFNDLRRAVLTGPGGGLKLIEFQGGGQQLYDLNADPRETRNIINDQTKLKEAKEAMARVRSTVKELPPQR